MTTYTLVIETATERGAIGIVDCDNRAIIALDQLPFGYQNSRYLLPRLEVLFEKTKLSPKDISFVTVGNGPGSYTGMRVGAVVGKTLAYSCQIPLVAVSSLAGFISINDGRFAALVDAKIGGVYVMKGEAKKGKVISQENAKVCTLDELTLNLEGVEEIVSPHPEVLQKKITHPYRWSEALPDVLHMGLLGKACLDAGQFSLDGSLDFLYLRKTQAEIENGSIA